MRALVVFESMYGNTHEVADAIGEGLRGAGAEVRVSSIHDVDPADPGEIDLLVVGGPTHAHSMSRDSTREAAVEAAAKDSELTLDPDMAGEGVREWLARLGPGVGAAAAFDTRVDMSPVLTGRASKGIVKLLRRHGAELVAGPESFLVTKQTHLVADQRERAVRWGAELGASVGART